MRRCEHPNCKRVIEKNEMYFIHDAGIEFCCDCFYPNHDWLDFEWQLTFNWQRDTDEYEEFNQAREFRDLSLIKKIQDDINLMEEE